MRIFRLREGKMAVKCGAEGQGVVLRPRERDIGGQCREPAETQFNTADVDKYVPNVSEGSFGKCSLP